MNDAIRGRRVLVTGGAGFLGRAVCSVLERWEPESITVPRSAEYDLVDPAAVARLFESVRPELVLHLAAEVGGIEANRQNPGRFFYANMAMGLHLIEEARIRGVRKFVQVGTVCAYPKYTPVPFCEENLWSGYPEETNAPYGVAKRALLVMMQAYRRQYGMKGCYLLPVNLYGPGDNFDSERSHVIPALIRKCVDAVETGADHIVCWGSGGASREFLYVDDCAEALVRAAAWYDGPEPVNLGSGMEIRIRELVEIIADLTGFRGRIEWDRSRPDGQPRRCLDVSRAASGFDFHARTPLEEGLKETIEWYRRTRTS